MSSNDVFVVHDSKVMLNNKNYTLWLIPIQANLYKIKYLNIVTGTLSCTDPKKDKDNSCFPREIACFQIKILLHLLASHSIHISKNNPLTNISMNLETFPFDQVLKQI
ncbi:hypothetical protein VP01_8020g1 [Puccinia sorghi]|uniref:Uncharacterized protein n=1 Tax=Puccinia sorghi TaxID=27349 RepID=A0A0L6UAI6_9BASI|nr:hypothetical protein VP01_8020g1 [Puccinia sorghi]